MHENRAIFALLAAAALSACIPIPREQAAFVGHWICLGGEGPELRLTERTAEIDRQRVAISQLNSYGPNYTLDLETGQRITLFDVGPDTMTYHLPQTGTTRSCERL